MRRAHHLAETWVKVLVISVALWCWAAPANAEPLAVIVNKNNPISAVSMTAVADMYRGETLHWQEGDRIKLVNRETSADTRKAFYLRALNAKPDQVFYRQGTPIPVQSVIQRTDDAVIQFVGSIEAAIGYVSLARLTEVEDGQVKVVLIIKDR